MNKPIVYSICIYVAAAMTFAALPGAWAQETNASTGSTVSPLAPAKKTDDCTSLEDEVKHLKIDRDNVLSQVKIAYQQKNDAEANLKKAKEEIDRLSEENKKLSSEIDRGGNNAYEQVDKLYKQTIEMSELLKKTRSDAYERIDKLEAENRRLSKELGTAARSTNQDASVQIPSMPLSDEAVLLRSKNEKLTQQLTEEKTEKEKFEQQNKELKSKVQALVAELDHMGSRAANPVIPENIAKAVTKSTELSTEFLNMRKERDRLVKENADLHYNLGVSMVHMGEYKKAIKEFLRAVELSPNDAESYFNLGKLYAEHLKRNSTAVRYFKKYMELKPYAQDAESIKKFVETVKALNAEKSSF